MPRVSQTEQQLAANNGADTEPELIMVGDTGTPLPDEGLESSDSGDDERLSTNEEQTAGDAAHTRETSRERRQRHQRSRDRNRTELNFLRSRNEDLERRFSTLETRAVGSEVQHLSSSIAKIQSDIALADQVIANALNADPAQNPKRGEDVTEAMRIRDELRANLTQLQGAHRQATAIHQESRAQGGQGGQPTGRTQAPTIDPVVKELATSWAADHPWYDPKGGDEDSAIVMALDNVVARKFDAKTPEYWEELSRRVEERLPHLFEDEGQDEEDDEDDEKPIVRQAPVQKPRGAVKTKTAARGGPRLTVGGAERPLKKNEVHISEARKQALIDKGVWDDPVLRKQYLSAYQRYDRDARAAAGRG